MYIIDVYISVVATANSFRGQMQKLPSN